MDTHPLRFIRNLGRSREIATVLLNHGFGDLVERLHLRRYLQWGKRVLLRKPAEPEPRLTMAVRIRMAFESLGATFIKFGQVISTRPDLVPADVLEELAKLQENVPPFSGDEAVHQVESELGAPVEELFADFDTVPVAAGSLGQVHRARHHDGTPLAVKIRRPNVIREVERDLSLLEELALLLDRYIPEAEIFDPVGLVNHFARTIRREMNYTRESRTIIEFAKLFRHDATLYVPKVYEQLTTDAVLTMEFVEGCHIDDLERIDALGVSRHDIAANGARIFMKQAFEIGLFHGDPHPGNIRILDDGSYCLLDYGMVGLLDEEKREALVDLFLSISHRDVKAAVQIVQSIGKPSKPIDNALLRADVRDFVENYYGLPLDRLNVGNMLNDFINILTTHAIRCPSDLMLLIRAIVTLEGVGRSLDPEFNLAEILRPYIENVVRERYHPKNIATRLATELRTFGQVAHDLPLQVGRILEKVSKDDLRIQLEHRRLDKLITELDRSSNRIVISMVISALVVASALIIRTRADSLWITLPVFILSMLLGIWLIFGIFRSGRL